MLVKAAEEDRVDDFSRPDARHARNLMARQCGCAWSRMR